MGPGPWKGFLGTFHKFLMGHFSGAGWVGKWEASGNRGVNTRCLKEVWVERKGELHREEKGIL